MKTIMYKQNICLNTFWMENSPIFSSCVCVCAYILFLLHYKTHQWLSYHIQDDKYTFSKKKLRIRDWKSTIKFNLIQRESQYRNDLNKNILSR